MTEPNYDSNYDIAILGCGLAGLTAALHLQQAQPSLTIKIIERKKLPYPEATHKVGESTVEVAAHYFAETLGLRQHLSQQQLRKLGLRLFFTAGDNRSIQTRPEMGSDRYFFVPTYQIDRGRFENFLVEEASNRGISITSNAKVTAVSISSDDASHTVTYEQDGATQSVRARWVIDASGRAAVVKRALSLNEPSEHDSNAVWFRVHDTVNIDSWHNDPAWLAGHDDEHSRWYSTNHLTDEGYWVWLIPLASGYTSIGIVTDPKRHPLARFRSFEDTQAWLREYEPQLAGELERREHLIADYLAIKHYAHKCSRVLSPDRWAITGDAGVFIDPLYSPGSDFIAIQNTFIVDTIVREQRGERFVGRCELYNNIYRQLTDNVLKSFHNQYDLLGNARVMPLKVIWDYTVYWGFLAFIVSQGKLCDVSALKAIEDGLQRVYSQNEKMQELVRARHVIDKASVPPGMLDIARIPFLVELNKKISTVHDETSFLIALRSNLELIGRVYDRLFEILSQDHYTWRTFDELIDLLASVPTMLATASESIAA